MAKHIKCHICEGEVDKMAKGLNKKLLGRKIVRFQCLSCLSNYLEISTQELRESAEEFKRQGCKLF